MHSAMTIYIFAALSIMFAISEFAVRIRCKAQRRTQELEQVELLLNGHYEALEYVFDDPAAPDEIKDILLWLSDSISDKKRAAFLVNEVFESKSKSQGPSVLTTDYKALRLTKPDLVVEIERAISTGFAALILRWPDTSRRAEIFMAEMIREDKDRAIAQAVKRAGNGGFGVGPLALAA